MDEDSDFPVVTYELVGVHDEATMVTITQLKESAPWESEVEYGE
jgi:hypothetical protein